MRIELNAGGLVGTLNVFDFEKDMSNLIDRVDGVISSFQTVKNSVYNMSGGVGNLQDAVNSLDARISTETNKKQNVNSIKQQVEDFLDNALEIDKRVAQQIRQNEEEFYKLNPWAKPPENTEKGFWDNLKDAFINGAEKIKEFIGDVKDTVKDAFNDLIKWYETSGAKEIVHIALTIGSIALETVLFLTSPLTALGIAGIIISSGALIVQSLDASLDITNEICAFVKKRQAIEAEENGDYELASRLRNEANALSDISSWRDIWSNDGVFNGWDIIGGVMTGIEMLDFGKNITDIITDTPKFIKNITSIFDTTSDVLKTVDKTIDLTKAVDKVSDVNKTFNTFDKLFNFENIGYIKNVVSTITGIPKFMDNVSNIFEGISNTFEQVDIQDIYNNSKNWAMNGLDFIKKNFVVDTFKEFKINIDFNIKVDFNINVSMGTFVLPSRLY